MATAKTPFYVVSNFISPKKCEDIIDIYGFTTSPDVDVDGKPQKMMKYNETIELELFALYQQLIPNLEKYYNYIHRKTEQMMIEWRDTGVADKHICESSDYIRKKWVRTKDRDFTAVLFLSDYQETIPFDSDYEVYGGKLEFPQHSFGFNPTRGTLIVYPSGPHFINVVAPIIVGEMYTVKFHSGASLPWLYQPADFPGTYKNWF